MNKYITIVELGEDATDFAQIIGIRGFEASRYICDAIDLEGNRIYGQTFTLPKSIEGLPPNNEAIKSDVLASWKSEEAKRKRIEQIDTL